MQIVLVEDDDLQAEEIGDALRRALPSVKVDWICSESTFRQRLPSIKSRPPDGIIMDLLLLWAEPGPGMPTPPTEIESESYYRAGIRCVEILRKEPTLRNVPVVLYTVIGLGDISGSLQSFLNVHYRQKDPDTDFFAKWIIGVFRQRKR